VDYISISTLVEMIKHDDKAKRAARILPGDKAAISIRHKMQNPS